MDKAVEKPINNLLDEGGLLQWVRHMAKYVDYINGRIRIKPDPVWTDATLLNSWANYGTPFFNAGYTVDPLGWVHFRGVIRNGTINASAFTLPPLLRPTSQVPIATISNNAIGRINVLASGSVIPEIGSNAFYFLDNLRYFPGP